MKKKKNILKLILFIIMIYLFIILGTKDYTKNIADNEKFSLEYKDITKNNVFKYYNNEKTLELLNSKSGILFMGFKNNIWSHYYAEYLNEIAYINNIEEIYYYDFYKDRKLNNKIYLKIVERLKDYLKKSDEGVFNLEAPLVVIINNGEILYVNNDISTLKGNISPENYFNEYEENMLKISFDREFKNYLEKGDLNGGK